MMMIILDLGPMEYRKDGQQPFPAALRLSPSYHMDDNLALRPESKTESDLILISQSSELLPGWNCIAIQILMSQPMKAILHERKELA